MKEIKGVHKPWYKEACKKVTRLLLSSTEKEDHELVKEKTNENIATAWLGNTIGRLATFLRECQASR